MNQQWKKFLASQGADFNNSNQVIDFHQDGQPPSSECLLWDLSHQGILAITGQDAGKFLQGQLSCDITKVNKDFSALGAYCSIKGRVISSFRIVHSDDAYLLVMHPELVAITQAVLNKYIVFFKAQMEDRSAQIVRLGLSGNNCKTHLQTLFNEIPEETNQLSNTDKEQLIRIPGPVPRFELWTTPEHAGELWLNLKHFAKPTGHSGWELLNIQSGLLELMPDMSEKFTPHNLNYQATGHIDFKKGCYTGQEVVARTHYRGQIKKRMYRIVITSSKINSLENNTSLVTDGPDETAAGDILSISQCIENNYEALAIISTNLLENSTLRLKSDHQSSIELLSLPYNV